MPIPSGWRFLSESELVVGNFKMNCNPHELVRNEITESNNENLELVKVDSMNIGGWYYSSKINEFTHLYEFEGLNVAYVTGNGIRLNDIKPEFSGLWKVVKKKPMKQNKNGSIEYGNSEEMSDEEIKSEITVHEARIASLKQSLEELKPKRFDLPGWLLVVDVGIGKKAVVVGDNTFGVKDDDWFKWVRYGVNPSEYQLEETTFDQLKAGDWFATDLDIDCIIGITDKGEGFDLSGVIVLPDGHCRDFSGGYVDCKFYKIVPKN